MVEGEEVSTHRLRITNSKFDTSAKPGREPSSSARSKWRLSIRLTPKLHPGVGKPCLLLVNFWQWQA
jgi:hypothetical protein